MNEIVLTRIQLPCSASQLESALLSAASRGHWNDAEAHVDEKGELVLSIQKSVTSNGVKNT